MRFGSLPVRSLSQSKRLLSTTAPSTEVRRTGFDHVIKYGPGGRSSVSGMTATVFGCTGFLGRYLVNKLGKKGIQVVIPYRGDELDYRHLKVMGDLGQIVPQFFAARDYESILQSVKHSQVVYNLIGRDYETNNFKFEDVHIDVAQKISKACREAGVAKLIHVSAMNADPSSKSKFLKTKAQGELAVKSEFSQATIVRPSNMYGYEDRFLHRIPFLHNYPFTVGLPVVKNAEQLLRPIYVGDVACGLEKLMGEAESYGKTYEFFGPKEYTYEDLINIYSDISRRPAHIVNYPPAILKLLLKPIELKPPSPKISSHDIDRMLVDDQPTGAPTIESLGLKTSKVEDIAIRLLRVYRPPIYFTEAPDEPEAYNKQ